MTTIMEGITRRQLAAILFADIAGYTALMQKDEHLALQKLLRFRQAIEELVPRHFGKIVQFYGDGCLLTFASSLEAVRCAMAVQQLMQSEPKVPVRIGAHQGDIIIGDDNVFGDSVNVAARVESMGVPGAILVSAKVRNDLKNQADIDFTSLGTFEFKNVEQPVEVFAVAGESYVMPEEHQLAGKLKTQNRQRSVAVLAFENRSSDPEQEYFSDGIAEDIIYALSRLENLKVAGRTASFAYKHTPASIPEIGHQLQVESILEGSIRKTGNRIRVSVQLVNAQDGFQIWTERFDRELEDIFAIQDEIATEVVHKLRLTLLGKEKRQPLMQRSTANVEAYELFLKGRSFLDQRQNPDAALTCFEQAVGIDPDFAMAYASIAYAYFYKIVFGNYPPRSGFPKAEKAAKQALAIDSTLAEAHNMIGLYAFYFEHDWEKARSHYEQSLLLQPHLADTYRIKAYFHSMLCEIPEAIQAAERAYEIDPVSYNNQLSRADIYYRARQFENAIAMLTDLNRQYPDNKMGRQILGNCYLATGQYALASEAYGATASRSSTFSLYDSGKVYCAYLQGDSGILEQFIKFLEGQRETKWISPTSMAFLYFHAGDVAQAISRLRQAIDERDNVLPVLNVDPLFDTFVALPEVREVLAEIGLRDPVA